jgi:hypothetical protein
VPVATRCGPRVPSSNRRPTTPHAHSHCVMQPTWSPSASWGLQMRRGFSFARCGRILGLSKSFAGPSSGWQNVPELWSPFSGGTSESRLGRARRDLPSGRRSTHFAFSTKAVSETPHGRELSPTRAMRWEKLDRGEAPPRAFSPATLAPAHNEVTQSFRVVRAGPIENSGRRSHAHHRGDDRGKRPHARAVVA